MKKRYPYIDVLKAIGMLEVLALHSLFWRTDYVADGWNIAVIIQYAIRLIAEGVPLFLAINGFLFFGSSSFNLNKHVKKTFKIFALFMIWAVVLVTLGSIDEEPLTLRLYVESILNTWVNSTYTGVLWFLQGLLAVYLIYPALKFLYDGEKKLYYYLFAVVAFFTVGLHLLDLILEYVKVFVPDGDIDLLIPFIRRVEPFNTNQVDTYIFFAMLGGVIRDKFESIKKNRKKFIIAGLASWGVAFGLAFGLSVLKSEAINDAWNFGSVFMAISIVGLFALMERYNGGDHIWNRFIESFGRHSFGIYLTHQIVIRVVNFAIPLRINNYDLFWQRLFILIVVSMLSWLVALIMDRIPYVQKLVRT